MKMKHTTVKGVVEAISFPASRTQIRTSCYLRSASKADVVRNMKISEAAPLLATESSALYAVRRISQTVFFKSIPVRQQSDYYGTFINSNGETEEYFYIRMQTALLKPDGYAGNSSRGSRPTILKNRT